MVRYSEWTERSDFEEEEWWLVVAGNTVGFDSDSDADSYSCSYSLAIESACAARKYSSLEFHFSIQIVYKFTKKTFKNIYTYSSFTNGFFIVFEL